MRLSLQLALIAVLFGLCASGCKKQESSPAANTAPAAKLPEINVASLPVTGGSTNAAASVGGVVLTQGELEEQVQAVLMAQAAQIPPEQLEQARLYLEHNFVQRFISKTVLLNEAKRLNVKPTDASLKKVTAPLEKAAAEHNVSMDELLKQAPMGAQKARQELQESATIEQLIETQVRAKIKVTDAEVDKEITSQVSENASNEQVRAAQRIAIESIRRQLLAGSNFESMAQSCSDCPSGKQSGGDLGPFARGQMVKSFEDAAFAQKVGEIGPIVESPFGFHVIKVTAHHAAKPAVGDAPAEPESVQASHILLKAPPPAPKREEIRQELEDAAMSTAMQAYMQDLRSKAVIATIFDKPAAAKP